MKIPFASFVLAILLAVPVLAQRGDSRMLDGGSAAKRSPAVENDAHRAGLNYIRAAIERARKDPRDSDPRPTENKGTRARDGQDLGGKGGEGQGKESKGSDRADRSSRGV